MKTLAIIKNGHDLLRIIPLKAEGNLVDFKISLMENDYRVLFWNVDETKPDFERAHEHVTYHSSKSAGNQIKSSEVHIKNPSVKRGNKYGYTFYKVTDLDTNTEFPIPILKMTYRQRSKKIYERKAYHFTVDLDDNAHKRANTAEVYFARKDFNYLEHGQKWPILSVLTSLAPIDYVVKGVDVRKDIVREFALGNILLLGTAFVYENFQLHCKTYYDKEVRENSLCFYENKDHLDMLATTPICLADKNYKPFTGIFPAFAYDLDAQLANGASFDKLSTWVNIFKSSLERMKSKNLNRKIMKIPQWKEQEELM